MKKIKESDIVDVITVCSYCMDTIKRQTSCCGESSNHFAEAVLTKDLECFLTSEVEILHSENIINLNERLSE